MKGGRSASAKRPSRDSTPPLPLPVATVQRTAKLRPLVYRLKVTLLDIKPPIWRRLLVTNDITFARLHLAIQEAMGWQNCHLHEFKVGDRRIGMANDEWSEGRQPDDERRTRLSNGLLEVGASVRYEYDFGDCWRHEIKVEWIEAFDPRFAYPLCVGGARACPPEDCGGAGGYARFLAALADAQHEEHDDLVTWIGGQFDPEGFDVNRANAAIRRAVRK